MLYAHEVILNELAQGLRPVADGVEWFEGLSDDGQRKAWKPPAIAQWCTPLPCPHSLATP
ncbi:DUF5958 family protein [Streptomyces mirabilis]|uniref:DUF5958 family protein n=1 Tax=Streptomyces mirabilis TaxID=68239 RepID=UPI00331D5804